ncbi:glycosyltransferase family 4 protein [Halorubrum ezzemoulense]|uniref:glycosyltransferase family 4 protein n=1 Tax=Halorubrum ezzemoulense TaxID=337243 RepID=UPI00232D7E28|nr:glycosyltransferase family 4 protein [Halorubrum ezzemoulense]MDB9252929.1 glycosyltransferase family 4 protein [Halorubrum ezzemoulense]MDB9256687.1 glycosyltransferase family 4 protein [Halorubrum ezzemoulense]MDB9278254.1 glycosyltransferase family 4 protein [Halorubrum ezzemoulense]
MMKILVVADHRTSEIVTPLKRSDAEVLTVNVNNNFGLVGKYVSLVVTVRRQIISEEPDVILTKSSSMGFISLLIGAYYQTSVVPSIAGDIFRQQKTNFWENIRSGRVVSAAIFPLIMLMHWLVVRCTPGVIVVSEHVAETLRSYPGMNEVQYAVVPVPKKVTPFLVDDETEPPMIFEADWTILTVTNLEFKGKFEGMKKALPAIYNVLRNRENCEYVVAGSGCYKDRLESHVENTVPNDDIRERIRFAGYVEDVHCFYKHADLFLYVSFEDGYPNVILEAMASGLPIVANPNVGIDEQIINGETGILVDLEQEEDLQEAIEGIFGDVIYYKHLGEQARETVRERNSHKSIGNQLVQGLADLLPSINQ